MASYEINPQILTEFLPFGTELDLFEDKCYVSLVGFMFVNTKLLGLKIPFHTNFEEVNLRFYVKRLEDEEWKRGVVFIKEIVPKPTLTLVANTIYKEHYETLPMKHQWNNENGKLKVAYEWKKKGTWNKFEVNCSDTEEIIEANGQTEFITEHYWGYARVNKHTTNEYEVTHPKWTHYPVLKYSIDVDFKSVYGAQFGFLNNQQPVSVILAEGSEITVESKRTIKN